MIFLQASTETWSFQKLKGWALYTFYKLFHILLYDWRPARTAFWESQRLIYHLEIFWSPSQSLTPAILWISKGIWIRGAKNFDLHSSQFAEYWSLVWWSYLSSGRRFFVIAWILHWRDSCEGNGIIILYFLATINRRSFSSWLHSFARIISPSNP